MKIRLEFVPQDLWVGLYVTKRGVERHAYLCLVPMFPLHFTWVWR